MKKAILTAVLALPSIGLIRKILGGALDDDAYAQLFHTTGELAVRFLILTIITTPLARIFKNGRFWKWMRLQRRIIGLASFGYAVLHVVVYAMHRGALQPIIDDLSQWTYVVGWLATIAMLILAITSNDIAIRKLGKRWKQLHLLVYPAVTLSLLHWLLKPDGEVAPVVVHTVFLGIFLVTRLVMSRRSARV